MNSISETKTKFTKPVCFKGHLEIFLQVNPDGTYKLETGFKNIDNDSLTDLMSMAVLQNLSEMYIDEYNNAVDVNIDDKDKLNLIIQDKEFIGKMNELIEAMQSRFGSFMATLAQAEFDNIGKVVILPGNIRIV